MKTRTAVNEAQEAVFNIMELATFNGFDGAAVVASLREHRKLWRGAIFGSFEATATLDLLRAGDIYKPACMYGVTLRDMPDGHYIADTLLITAAVGQEQSLEALARTWCADEIGWDNIPHAGKALRVWWD